MRSFVIFLAGMIAGIIFVGTLHSYRDSRSGSRDISPTGIQVHFSPKGGCTEACVEAINSAADEVLVQDYSFTSEPIAQALVAARKRGVSVRVIMDRSVLNEKSSVDVLYAGGVDVWIDARHAIAHNKIVIIDGSTVLTGSFNFTKQAETSNAENLVRLPPSEGVGPIYAANWNAHLTHSTQFKGRSK